MTARTAPVAALMLLLAGMATATPPGRRHVPTHRPAAAAPQPAASRAPRLGADGLPTFAEAAAPLAPAEQRIGPRALEPQVQAMLAARCPAQPIAVTGGRARLVAFDAAFTADLGQTAAPAARQVALEAYRRCIDRAIAAIQASPNYVVRNPQDAACVRCQVYLSDLAMQVPRLRVLSGLTWLAPPRMADQDPHQALDTLRAGVEEFGTVQTAFQQQAQAAFDQKRRIVQQGRSDAEHQAAQRGKGAALTGLLGAGLGLARGQGAGDALHQAGSQLVQVGRDLANNERQVAMQQSAINSHKRDMFGAPAYGNWSDDGIRVTLPRVTTVAAQGGGTIAPSPFGALASAFHAGRIVRIIFRSGRDDLSACTGSIVGPRLIVTNRHCVTSESGEGAVLAPNAFTIEWRAAAATDTGMQTAVTTYHVARVVTTDMAQHLSDTSINDWAFLVMREKVGTDGWLRLVDPARVAAAGEFRIALAGYSADLNEGSEITMDWGCRARWLNNSLFHRCHMWSGASGSPIVAADGAFARDEIVALNAADYGHLHSGSDEGLRVGPSSADMYAMYLRLRAEQRGDE